MLEINAPSLTVAQISASSVVCGTEDIAEEIPESAHVESSGGKGRPWKQPGHLSFCSGGEAQGDNLVSSQQLCLLTRRHRSVPLPVSGDVILGIDLAEYCVLQARFADSIVLVCKALAHPLLVSAQVFVIPKSLPGHMDLIAVILVQAVHVRVRL